MKKKHYREKMLGTVKKKAVKRAISFERPELEDCAKESSDDLNNKE